MEAEKKQLTKDCIPDWNIVFFDKVTSTNDVLFNLIKKGYSVGTVVVANSQLKGKGRYSKKWISNTGGIYLSIFLDENIDISKVAVINLLAALSVAVCFDELFNVPVYLKWPNDIFLKDKKLSGILTENKIIHKKNILIVGIGINSNNMPSDSLKSAVSLKEFLKKEVDNDLIIKNVLSCIKKIYNRYNESEYRYILKKYNRYSMLKNKTVKVKCNNLDIKGKVEGIDLFNGALIIRDFSGKQISVLKGTVNLIK